MITREDIDSLLGKVPPGAPVPGVRVSKHRGGRAKPLTSEQRKRKAARERRLEQSRKNIFLTHQADLRALQAAMADD